MPRITMVAVEKCVIPDVRITAVYDEELQRMLHDSLDAVGQVVPIIVISHDGQYYVADGRHRLEEARARGDKTIPAVVREGAPEDVLLLNLVTNRLRGKVKASELVQVIALLNQNHGLTSDQIAQRTGMTRDTIEKYCFVATASPEVIEALDMEVIGIGHAYEIARLPRFEQQAEILAKYQVWKWPVQALKEQISAILALMEPQLVPTVPTPPARAPIKPKCAVCNQEYEVHDLRPVILCLKCYGDAWNLANERAKEAKPLSKLAEKHAEPPTL